MGRITRPKLLQSNFHVLSRKWESIEKLETLVKDGKIGRYDHEVLTNMIKSENETDNYIASCALDMRIKGLINDEVSENTSQNNTGTSPTNL